ncbi:MAG TPA: alpha/beta hydrolase [Rhizomicrobium sp.]|jgi:pimeloyl-ACP methyl ester carboxylesterase
MGSFFSQGHCTREQGGRKTVIDFHGKSPLPRLKRAIASGHCGTMALFAESPDGLRIAYETVGQGIPVLLVHGFASSRAQNWRATGWYKTLSDAGFQVIAMDCRGHGDSDKPHGPAAYSYELMSGDILCVAATVGLPNAHVIGYSMGGHLGIHVLMQNPELVRKLVIAGVGATYFHQNPAIRYGIADALLAPDATNITDPTQKSFRAFAGQPGKDIVALAACMRGERHFYSSEELAESTRPALVICGEDDDISGPPGPLAAALRDAVAVAVPGRDHMSAVGDKATKAAVIEFLGS